MRWVHLNTSSTLANIQLFPAAQLIHTDKESHNTWAEEPQPLHHFGQTLKPWSKGAPSTGMPDVSLGGSQRKSKNKLWVWIFPCWHADVKVPQVITHLRVWNVFSAFDPSPWGGGEQPSQQRLRAIWCFLNSLSFNPQTRTFRTPGSSSGLDLFCCWNKLFFWKIQCHTLRGAANWSFRKKPGCEAWPWSQP